MLSDRGVVMIAHRLLDEGELHLDGGDPIPRDARHDLLLEAEGLIAPVVGGVHPVLTRLDIARQIGLLGLIQNLTHLLGDRAPAGHGALGSRGGRGEYPDEKGEEERDEEDPGAPRQCRRRGCRCAHPCSSRVLLVVVDEGEGKHADPKVAKISLA